MTKFKTDNLFNNTSPDALGKSFTNSSRIKDSTRLEKIVTGDDSVYIAEPISSRNPRYPYNDVKTFPAGHIKEYDSTLGAERIMEMHSSGTFYEISPDGTKVTKIFGNNFDITINDDNLIIGGNRNITIQGNSNIIIKGDVVEKIEGNVEKTIFGNYTTRVKGDYKIISEKDITMKANNFLGMFDNILRIFTTNNLYLEGLNIYLNKRIDKPNFVDKGFGLSFPKCLFSPIKSLIKLIVKNESFIDSIDDVSSGIEDRV